MSINLPECPASLRQIQHYLKTANEHDNRDPVVAYWCRLHALQVGLKLSSKKTPEETKLLMGLMDWLEKEKNNLSENEAVTNEIAAQAYLENYALKLFLYADKQDREANFGKNVVKAFYTSGMIYDVLTTFGELTDEVVQNRKYAKWKAAYIHNCLKNGETPVSGPMPSEDNENLDDTSDNNMDTPSTSANNPPQPFNAFPSEPAAPAPDSLPSVPYTPNPDVGGFQPYNPAGFHNIPIAPNVLPSVPHTPDPNPGGFHPFVPGAAAPSIVVEQTSYPTLTPEQTTKVQKYCKWASSALTYDDVKTAVENLKSALQLLQTGHE